MWALLPGRRAGVWNALAGRLWSRTTSYLYRTLAQLAGVSEAELRRLVRISFAKVAEYQKRGAIHFHAMGHKSASITLDRYGHLFPEELDHMADRLDRCMRRLACTQRVPTPRWPPLDNAKRQVSDLPLLVEVGRLELHRTARLRSRSGDCRSSDLRVLRTSADAGARCCPSFAGRLRTQHGPAPLGHGRLRHGRSLGCGGMAGPCCGVPVTR